MICYKDKTFCPYSQCAKFNNCPDALTEKVKEGASKWWGKDDAPIMEYIAEPSCFESSNNDTEHHF